MRASSARAWVGHWLGLALLAMFALPVQAAEDLAARKREAGLPATPPARLFALAADPSWEVREVLGRNRRAPQDLLARLAADPDPRVRIAVATNLTTGEAIHLRLARDPDPSVRSVVARFEYLPIPVLLLLGEDPLVDIRLEVARSLNADEQVLRKMMADTDPAVARTAELALQALRGD